MTRNRQKSHLAGFVALVALLTIAKSAAFAESIRSLEIEEEELNVSGLSHPVEIINDRWGIPHIYAKNQNDLFFAQGFNAAKDRLFQFEIWRRRALGLLAEIQGEKALQHDIGARLLKFRGDMQQEMRHYHEDGEEIIGSFVKGVNAYIDIVGEQPELLPLEFRLLGIKPGYWTREVVTSRHNAFLFGGADQELTIAKSVHTLGAKKTEETMAFLHPPNLKPKEGINLGDIREDVTAIYRASRNPPKFTKEDVAGNRIIRNVMQLNFHDVLSRGLRDIEAIGSNNWVIAGDKTASGYPILANDPHRAIEVPSLRYWAHLVAPGWNVIGGGEPVLPGISIGHNEYGAWGLTIFPIDQEDLYVYDINPGNPDQYWYEGRWESMQRVTEDIPVKGRSSHRAVLKYTRHGPVLYEDRTAHKAYALRAVWLDKGAAPYLASLRVDQATSWQEFREACAYSGLPGENMIWADRKGNIGWQAVGFTPVRIGWDGILPVPGDGRYEWAGHVPIKSMPHVLNPREGHWASANYNNVPEGYPNIFSFFSWPPYRLNRIREILDAGNGYTIEDSMIWQHDTVSLPARALVPLLSRARFHSNMAARAVNRLLRWDRVINKESIEAAIYSQWQKELATGLAARAGIPSVPIEKMLEWLTAPDVAPDYIFGSNAIEERDRFLMASMETAVEKLAATVGPNMDSWQYGQEKLHYSKIVHPLSDLVDEKTRSKLDVGPAPKGGDENTLNFNKGERNQLSGASFRIIVDASDWDLTKGTSTPGQSGDVDSPHYRDLFEVWANEKYFPVYYSREKIDEAATQKLLLKPSLEK